MFLSISSINNSPKIAADTFFAVAVAFFAEGGNANTATKNAALLVETGTTARWGMGGTYTRGGVNQTGGGNIGDTSDTLIAIPAR